MLTVWWDAKGVILWEVLPHNQTVTAQYYCNQLQRLDAQLALVRPRHGRVLFLHDNARPHTAKCTRDKLLQLGYEVLPHPAYSPDIAPSDYWLFRALDRHLREKSFADENALKMEIGHFFDSQPETFYKDGINALPDRWRRVVDADGDYLVE
jgi:histone-lysine N-methyltransferase SETMAR